MSDAEKPRPTGRPPSSESESAGHGSQVPLEPGLSLPKSIVRFTFVRSSGPGGQNVNKLNTKACLHVSMSDLVEHCGLDHSATARLRQLARTRINSDDEIVIQSSRHRSQRRNRQECLQRLSQMIEAAQRRPSKRLRTRPSRASVERRLASKRKRADVKQRRKRVDDGGAD
ncbi:MAG: aminoacyl-tRNA hydrolase [Planctomycetes bacterium]|nr:aminoacyl-tRNA hydrolase [Planctomycetota bacterium]NOG53649.1 aminoacyl-tRNA hydrolase [Planctomycetota bacterium]